MSASPAALSAAITIPTAELEDCSSQEVAQLTSLTAHGRAAAAVASTPPKAYVDSKGTLIIQGCGRNDWVNVVDNQGAPATLFHKVDGNWVVYQQKFYGVKRIEFLGFQGANEFHNNTNLPSAAVGGTGVDRFYGGGGADTFFGNGGNDILFGYGGSDALFGGTGDDWLYAGKANECNTINILKGGRGVDHLFGSGGFDKMYGGKNVDKLRDDNGNGYLHGGAGDDVLYGLDYQGNGIKLEMHGGGGADTLIVKPGVYAAKLGTFDDYFNDNIFKPAYKSLKTLTPAVVDKLLS